MNVLYRFIKTISLMIQHTAVLHQAAPNKVDESMQLQFEDIGVLGMDSSGPSSGPSKGPSNAEPHCKDKAAVSANDSGGVREEEEEKKGIDGAVEVKPIENQDIKRMQDIAFDLFQQFNAQSHREVLRLTLSLSLSDTLWM